MAVTLYEHQKAAVEKLRTGSVLCGGVGSGKTRAALAYYYTKIGCGKLEINGQGGWSPMKNPLPLYVITTARKRDTLDWEKECTDFLFYPTKVDSWNNISKYVGIKGAMFIFDEQRVVGSGVWVKSFLKIAANNEWILLSATPGDTWLDYIPIFIANGFYKNRTEFIRRHIVYNNFSKFPKVDHYIEVSRLIKLRDSVLVNMHFVRRTIRHSIDVKCDYDREKMNRLQIDRWNIFEERPVKDISELCFLMRRVANTDISRQVYLEEYFLKHKTIIVFYNFNYELDILKKFCQDRNICYRQWNGHVHEMIPDEDEWIYLVQYTAGNEGWNAIETNSMIFYSQNYSYKVLEQAMGRIDRLNTPFDDLYYYHFISVSPIDLAIRKAINTKQIFNESRFTNC